MQTTETLVGELRG